MRVMEVRVESPGWIATFERVVHARLEAVDGARGFQPGHEAALVRVVPGPVELSFEDGGRAFLATEGGIAEMARGGLRLVTSWAAQALDLGTLASAVRRRDEDRRAAEEEARALALRHEKTAQRALVALRRGAES